MEVSVQHLTVVADCRGSAAQPGTEGAKARLLRRRQVAVEVPRRGTTGGTALDKSTGGTTGSLAETRSLTHQVQVVPSSCILD